MHVQVEFCMMWNFAPKAASFAEDVFSELRHHVKKMELIPASGGVFEIRVDNELIYSKKETGSFPDHDEILEMLKDRIVK